jgi:hypothetical protein
MLGSDPGRTFPGTVAHGLIVCARARSALDGYTLYFANIPRISIKNRK